MEARRGGDGRGTLLARRNSCHTTGNWQLESVAGDSQLSTLKPKGALCQIIHDQIAREVDVNDNINTRIGRKNDEKRRKRIPKFPGNMRTNNMSKARALVYSGGNFCLRWRRRRPETTERGAGEWRREYDQTSRVNFLNYVFMYVIQSHTNKRGYEDPSTSNYDN